MEDDNDGPLRDMIYYYFFGKKFVMAWHIIGHLRLN